MEVIELGRLVALDLNSAVASNYDHIQPLPLPGPLVPYQVRRQDDDESDPVNDRPRKRRKRSNILPDSNSDAISRHSPIEQALGEALPSLHSWMATKGTNSLCEALGVTPPAISTVTATDDTTATAAASPNAPAAPDYVSLSSLARVVKPKFSWADFEENTTEDENEEESDVDLFNHVISNDRDIERRGLAFGHPVVSPGHSTFLMSDAHALHALMQRESSLRFRFHCIVVDPPWENASVKRAAGSAYPTLPNYSLLNLPIKKLAAANGVLVCLWVTNREKLRRFVDTELLPAWGLQPVATWHWLKVSDGGAVPVTPLDSDHRRPYESLLLCNAAGVAAPWDREKFEGLSSGGEGDCNEDLKGWRMPTDGLVIAAMPTVHSRKPHLGALLKDFLPPGASCLEMFARECHRGWTSWGNEVLKFQGLEYFGATE